MNPITIGADRRSYCRFRRNYSPCSINSRISPDEQGHGQRYSEAVSRFAEDQSDLIVSDKNPIAVIQLHAVAQRRTFVWMVKTGAEHVAVNHSGRPVVCATDDPDLCSPCKIQVHRSPPTKVYVVRFRAK